MMLLPDESFVKCLKHVGYGSVNATMIVSDGAYGVFGLSKKSHKNNATRCFRCYVGDERELRCRLQK